MTNGHDYITLDILGLATLSSAPIEGAIACLGQPPRVIAAEMDPTQCYPSDAGATFLVNATAEFRSTVMRRGELIGTLASPLWSGFHGTDPGEVPGFWMTPADMIPEGEITAWIGNQKMIIILDSASAPEWYPYIPGAFIGWMRLVERGVDETPVTRIDIPFETSMTSFGGAAVAQDRPFGLEGLACEYTMHYADGTSRTLLRGQIRSVVDSGDTVSIRIASEISSIMDQEWLPPRSLPGLGYSDDSAWLMQNKEYFDFALAQPDTNDWGYNFAPSLLVFDVVAGDFSSGGVLTTPGGSTARPVRGNIDNPASGISGEFFRVPALSFGAHATAEEFDFLSNDEKRTHARRYQAQGVDPREHQMFAAFSGVGPDDGIDLNNGTPITDIDDSKADKSSFALFRGDMLPSRDWGALGLYGSVAYMISDDTPVPSDFIEARDVLRTTEGVYSKSDGWGDIEELPQIYFSVAGDIVPLPRAISAAAHPLDFALAQVNLGAIGNTYGVGVSGLQSSLDLRLDLVDMTPKVNAACSKYFSDVYDDQSWDDDDLRAVCSVLLDDYNIPLEFVWGRRFKDTFFSDLWAQFAIVFVSGADARLRPIFLGEDFSEPVPGLEIDASVVRDRDHSIQFSNEPVIGSIIYKETPERYAYARTPAENTEVVSSIGALWGSRGESISVPLSTYMRRDPFCSLRGVEYTGKYSPIDVSIACWSAALRNYSKPFPTVVLVVDGRYKGFPGDVVRVRLPNMPAPDGTIGVDGMRAQIWERGDDVREGTAEIKLLLIGWWDE